jgi:lipid-binding SYLF domain-containing protein
MYKNKNLSWFAGVLVLLALGLSGCGSIPGETEEEQVETIDALVERTLADLYNQDPKTKDEIASSVGYIVMNNKITKVPMVGAGTGYGVAIATKTQERTYLRMARFDVGGGWGARSLRPVLIFHKEEVFKDFINGKWEAQVGAEAAAKVGETGAAGGGGSSDLADKGYSIHMITDAGVSATVTAGVIRVKPVKLKE